MLISILLIFFILAACAGWILLYLAHQRLSSFESYVKEINISIADFRMKIEAMFDQNIHYYDDTIFEFVETTKEVKDTIDKVLTDYEDLTDFKLPNYEPQKPEQDVLGVVKHREIMPSSRI